MADKIIVSTTTKEASFNVYVDYDDTKPTGFYKPGDNISVRVYATGADFINFFVHSQEFKITTPSLLSNKFTIDNFTVPEETTKLTAFCVYGSRLDNGYPENLDPEFCTDIEAEWKVEVAIPEITMDQWAYFNTASVTSYSSSILPVYTVPNKITGTTTSIVPFDVKFSVTKDAGIYGSNDIPLLDVTTITPNQDGTWELPLSTVIPPTTNTILEFIKQNQHATLTFMYNGEVIHTQNVYYPTIYVDSANTSMSRSVASVFDIGGFYDMQPCMVVNMEQDYALIGRYMERQTTSKYTFIEYSTNTDSVLIGPNMDSNYDSYDTWRSIVKDKTYYQDGQPTNFDDYTFQINGVLTGPNSLAITRKYKFIYPDDNISLELEMLPGQFGSILDNTIDSFYNKTLAINNKIVENGIFDINDVSPTTGDTADYFVSVLSSTDRDPSILYEQQYIGSTTLGTTIFKPSYVYDTITMNGVSYTSNGYLWSPVDEIDISIGRFPVGTNKVICAMPLNRDLEFTSDLKYVISKGYSDVPTAPSDIYGVLIVGTPSLGTISVSPTNSNLDYTKIVARGGSHTLFLNSATGTVSAIGYRSPNMSDLNIKFNVTGWTNITKVEAGVDYSYGLKNDGTVVAAGQYIASWRNLEVSVWSNIVDIAAGRVHALGLRSDGTVAVVGPTTAASTYLAVSGWTDIKKIYAGDTSSFGIKSDGTLLVARNTADSTQTGWNFSTWINMKKVAISKTYGRHVLGLKNDGTVVVTGNASNYTTGNSPLEVSSWTNIIDIAATDDCSFGLRTDGTVVYAGKTTYTPFPTVSTWTGIKAIFANANGIIGIKEDGTMVSDGNGLNNDLIVAGIDLIP